MIVRGAALAAIPVAGAAVYLTYSRAGAIAVPLGAGIVVALGPRRWLAAAHMAVAALATAAVVAAIRSAPGVAHGTSSAGAARVALVVVLAAAASAAAVVLLGRTGLAGWRTGPRATRIAAWAAVAVLVALAAGLVGGGTAGRAWDSFRTPTDVRANDPAARSDRLGARATGTGARRWLHSGTLRSGDGRRHVRAVADPRRRPRVRT